MAHSFDTTKLEAGAKPHGVFCLIRFDHSLAFAYRNSLKRQISVLQRNFSGAEIVFVPRLNRVYGSERRTFGMGLLHFSSFELANQWLISSPEIRQPDWIYNAEIIFIPARAPFFPDMPIVELMIFTEFHDVERFQEAYLSKLCSDEIIGRHNVIAAPEYCCQRVRGCLPGQYIVLNQWTSMDALMKSQEDPYNEKRNDFFTSVANGSIYLAANDK